MSDANSTPSIKVLYFAWLRDRLGYATKEVAFSEKINSVSKFVEDQSVHDRAFSEIFSGDHVIRVAVNQAFTDYTAPLKAGDELAFFPPVTGG